MRAVWPGLLSRCRAPPAGCGQRGRGGGIVLSKAPQRRLAVRRGALIGLLQAELLEIAQFADSEIDTHVTTKAALMSLVKMGCAYGAGQQNPTDRIAGCP